MITIHFLFSHFQQVWKKQKRSAKRKRQRQSKKAHMRLEKRFITSTATGKRSWIMCVCVHVPVEFTPWFNNSDAFPSQQHAIFMPAARIHHKLREHSIENKIVCSLVLSAGNERKACIAQIMRSWETKNKNNHNKSNGISFNKWNGINHTLNEKIHVRVTELRN